MVKRAATTCFLDLTVSRFLVGAFAPGLGKPITGQAQLTCRHAIDPADIDKSLAISGGIQYESPCNCWGMRIGAAQESDRRVLKLGGLRTPVTDVRFSIDLHPPNGVRRTPEAPGGR